MRFFYLIVLLAFVVGVAAFAVQNNEAITLRYFGRNLTTSFPLLVGAVYVLGMLSGWTVVGLLRRSLERVTERRDQ
jgi:putative membrane protein